MRSNLMVGILTAALMGCSARAPAAVTVNINASLQYQTILGWGKTTPHLDVPPMLRDQILDQAVNDLGLTRLRLEPPSGNRSHLKRWEWLNDNGDPYSINWDGFNTTALDARVSQWVVPFKQRVEANGDPFSLYVSPSFFNGGSSGRVPDWLLHSPDEYAEWAAAILIRLRDQHNIRADYYCICNEAGNNNLFSPQVVGKMIKTLGPMLQQLGLPTKIQFPEGVSADESWRYIQALQNDAEIWRYIGLITYHLYGKNDARPTIRDFAIAKGLPTGQTEYMGLTIHHLYDDLVLGGVSYWEIYGLAGPQPQSIKSHASSASFRGGAHYWDFRQVMHYVRPGAVRVEATSDDPALRVLAFVRNGKTTVVFLNNTPPHQARTVTVNSLPPGVYGVCQSLGRQPYQELGLKTVTPNGALMLEVPANSVLTIYPHPGTNQPPTVTDWRATPNYLTMPASKITLSASATDPENDAISYLWSVVSQPEGAHVVLTTPETARTLATGLTVAGEYLFSVAVSDRGQTVTRNVMTTVFPGNKPPVPVDVHNRIPVMVILPTTGTELRAGAWDLEGDPLTFLWSIVSQPAGAVALLESPTKPKCKVSNMSMAGNYVFKFQVSDPTHTVSENLTVTVYPRETQ